MTFTDHVMMARPALLQDIIDQEAGRTQECLVRARYVVAGYEAATLSSCLLLSCSCMQSPSASLSIAGRGLIGAVHALAQVIGMSPAIMAGSLVVATVSMVNELCRTVQRPTPGWLCALFAVHWLPGPLAGAGCEERAAPGTGAAGHWGKLPSSTTHPTGVRVCSVFVHAMLGLESKSVLCSVDCVGSLAHNCRTAWQSVMGLCSVGRAWLLISVP